MDRVTYKQKFTSHSSGGWKPKVKVPTDSASGESPLPDCRLLTPHRVLHEGRSEGALWGLFRRALIPFVRAPPSWPNHLPQAPPPKTIILGIRFQHMNLGKQTFRPAMSVNHHVENVRWEWKRDSGSQRWSKAQGAGVCSRLWGDSERGKRTCKHWKEGEARRHGPLRRQWPLWHRSVFFFVFLLHIIKVCELTMWYTYTLWNSHYNQANEHIHPLTWLPCVCVCVCVW